ncbi:MAG: hypothetical protein PUH29_11705 [Lachnospiraceae bacterium]|nr:hypothetical protein [Lachnospiraceae bacterium]
MKKSKLMLLIVLSLCCCLAFPKTSIAAQAKAKTVKTTKKSKKKKKKETDITPKEPSSSDLKVIHEVTKPASKRWVQSYTMDSKYYYYIQMTSVHTGNLRVTRVKYKGFGRYLKDYMTLRRFGHATNLDCSISNGRTWLWTGSDCKKGSDVSQAITGFRYKKYTTLTGHGPVQYQIPMGTDGKYATNVYPAINQDSTRMAVRYTYKGMQYYQIYNLVDGLYINPDTPVRQFCLWPTTGDFQGFDIYKSTIYTIEGSPRNSFLKTYDSSRRYQPTVIRAYHYNTGVYNAMVVHGAKKLTFREPEGIKVLPGRKIYIMYVSNKLTDQSCNIYRLKKKI